MKRHHNRGLRKLCDCPRRAWPACAHAWHLNYKPRYGRSWRVSLDRELRRHISSRAEALQEATRIRAAIDAGTFRPAAPAGALTVRDVVHTYRTRHVQVPTRRAHAREAIGWHLDRLCAARLPAAGGTTIALGDKPIAAVTKADVEALRDGLRAAYAAGTQRAGVKAGETGINRLLGRLRHVFSWAIREGYAAETPFRRHGVTMIALEMKAEQPRTRRLEPGEEDALRQHAGPHLRALIVAALSTGCRVGELLSMQWQQIRRDDQGVPRWILLAADDTKTNEARALPIGAALRAELELRATDAAGEPWGPQAFVFGTTWGGRIQSIKTAWRATCRRAGVVGLHVHDLRREFGSRLLESGAELHDVAEFLGHANITTTSRYLKSTPLRLERALARMETTQVRTPLGN